MMQTIAGTAMNISSRIGSISWKTTGCQKNACGELGHSALAWGDFENTPLHRLISTAQAVTAMTTRRMVRLGRPVGHPSTIIATNGSTRYSANLNSMAQGVKVEA